MNGSYRCLMGAYLIWGLGPIFWKLLADLPADYVLAHRILWSFVLLFIWCLASDRLGEIKEILRGPRCFSRVLLSAALIGGNWFFYIYAIQIGRTWEASLGYFILPLFSVGVGALFFAEQLRRVQVAAVLLAATGVVLLALQHGEVPLIALTLAGTFLLYSLLHRGGSRNPLILLLIESAFLSPLAVLYLSFSGGSDDLVSLSTWQMLLLVSAAPISVLPLFLFNSAVKKVPMSVIGITQYTAPTLQLLVAVLVFGEDLSIRALLCFVIIWSAILLFFVPKMTRLRQASGL